MCLRSSNMALSLASEHPHRLGRYGIDNEAVRYNTKRDYSSTLEVWRC